MMRVFVALDVPHEVRSQLAVQQFLLPIPRKVDPAQFHLTLGFLGEQSDAVLEAVHEELLALRSAGFTLSLSGFGIFGKGKPHSVWAAVDPSEPLTHLQSKVERCARIAGVTLPACRFVPHVTLGRFAALNPEAATRLERAVVNGAGFRAGPWQASELVLYQSTLTPDGPRYDEAFRYPLKR
ncbi:RNA 2',3'-cyclic phosphodiesterase [Pseudorhodobacter sp.]|uniref:RNA 2',3'-cyclic phosphodiesterase n=1 Tax=Pseudorhodobacter sp. TaxID=1934400 RepID=UPI002648EE0D|nr:RNA 2',3'-cyclic phosphodiesterase [Pseudorhodobacter sp.]MDN5786456.1 RNA 2',3'-cyclic phosphodiesterase [Pseudorhodobacter sp.]